MESERVMRQFELELPAKSILAFHSDRYAITKAAVLAREKNPNQEVICVIFELYDTHEGDFNYASSLFVTTNDDVTIAHLKSSDSFLISPTSEGEESMVKILSMLSDDRVPSSPHKFSFPVKCISRILTKDLLVTGYSLMVMRNSEILVCALYNNLTGEKSGLVATVSYDGAVPTVSVSEELREGVLALLKADPASRST